MARLDEMLYDLRRIEEHREMLTEKKIRSIYRSLNKDLSAFVAEEYVKYADEEGKLFLSYLDSKNKRAKFLSEIARNVDSISPEVKKEMLDMVDKTYEKAFKGIANAVKNADDTKDLLSGTDTLVRPEVLKQAVNNNIDKLTLDAVMQKHRAEIIADIQQTVTLGLMRGDRYETMAKRIQERLGVSYSKASNIARTESHRNIESGLMDGAKETAKIIDQDGDLIYAAIWRTMKDERVRPQVRRKTKKGWITTKSTNGANHQKMEGVTIKVGEKFQLEPDVYAECPSNSGTARNDCNCRCFLQYKLMTVAEFAKATGQTEEAVRKKYKMSPEQEHIFVPAKTIDEAEQYAEKFAKSASYKGATNLNNVNKVNETLEDLTTRFPTNKVGTLNTNGRLKRANARACFDELEINTSYLNNDIKPYDWAARIEKDKKQAEHYKTFLGNPKYDQKAIKKYIREVEEEVKFSRWSVSSASGDIADTIRHEYGHIVADQYIGQINGKWANGNFAHNSNNELWKSCRKVDDVFEQAKKSGDIYKISRYANTNSHEFFAETFTMYAKGEKLPDYIEEMMKEVLDGGIL